MKNEKTVETTEIVEILETEEVQETSTPVYRTTSTGRPTLVGTRHCSDCGRAEFHTKKFDTSKSAEDLNPRYTLCKGVCVYCYAKARNKTAGTSLSVAELQAKIKFYTDLLSAQTAPDTSFDSVQTAVTVAA